MRSNGHLEDALVPVVLQLRSFLLPFAHLREVYGRSRRLCALNSVLCSHVVLYNRATFSLCPCRASVARPNMRVYAYQSKFGTDVWVVRLAREISAAC